MDVHEAATLGWPGDWAFYWFQIGDENENNFSECPQIQDSESNCNFEMRFSTPKISKKISKQLKIFEDFRRLIDSQLASKLQEALALIIECVQSWSQHFFLIRMISSVRNQIKLPQNFLKSFRFHSWSPHRTPNAPLAVDPPFRPFPTENRKTTTTAF